MKDVKQKIIDTASELFSELGFWAVSMESIAGKLKVTKPALYYHFKGKRDLYFKAVNNSFDNLMTRMRSKRSRDPKKKLMEMSRTYLISGLDKRSFAKMAAHVSFDRKDSKISEHLSEMKAKVVRSFERTIRGINGKERDAKSDALLLVGTMDGLMMNANLSGRRRKAEKQLEKIVSMITKVEK